jgi:hypothetical protein
VPAVRAASLHYAPVPFAAPGKLAAGVQRQRSAAAGSEGAVEVRAWTPDADHVGPRPPHSTAARAQLQSAASSPAAGGGWGPDGSGWAGRYAPGANEAALRAHAALALGVGVDSLPQARRVPAAHALRE